MNKNDLKNPLIQSGIILLIVFLLIAIVANSEPQGFLGSIAGLASGILFLIGLFIAIVVSIAIIIGLFLGAVSIYSIDKGREFTGYLRSALASFYERVRGSVPSPVKTQAVSKQADAFSPAGGSGTEVPVQAETVMALQKQVLDQQQMVERFNQVREDLAEVKGRLAAMEEKMAAVQEEIEEDLADLRDKMALPDVVSGILSYIDRPEDRELVTSKAEEAVARGLTYAQIDEFFQASLSPELFSVLSTHPRLTKDFIRSIKKKFE
ncbi:MAG: hypothetical protein RBS34_03120 [Desulfofustis sp.]|jgi:hypothetical protein|nr:hypothetical protein [Desulfofustis sp.]